MKLEWKNTHEINDHKLANWSTCQYFESWKAKEKNLINKIKNDNCKAQNSKININKKKNKNNVILSW